MIYTTLNAHVSDRSNTVLALLEFTWLHFDTNVVQLVLELGDDIFGTGVGPDNGFAEGLSSLPAPGNGGFTLVGDTYGTQSL